MDIGLGGPIGANVMLLAMEAYVKDSRCAFSKTGRQKEKTVQTAIHYK